MTFIYRHDKTQVSYGYEATWGTAGVGSIWPGHVQSHTPDWNLNIDPKRYVGSNNRTVDDFYVGMMDIKGRLEIIPQDWKWLYYAFGKTTDTGSPVYTHTIVESGALPSITIYDAFISATATNAGNVVKYADGVKVDTLEISGKSGDPLSITIDYIGKTGSVIASGAVPTVTAATTKVYQSRMAHLANVTGGAFSAQAFGTMKEHTVLVKNNLEPKPYQNNSNKIGALETKGADYEVRLKVDAIETVANKVFNSLWQGGSALNADLYYFRTSGTDQAHLWISGGRVTDMGDISTKVEPGSVELDITIVPKTMGAIVKDAIPLYV